MNRSIDHFLDVSERHRRLISIVGFVWLALSWADNARFIDLPTIPFLTGTSAIIASSMANALWWGFINPRIERRRKERAEPTSTAGAPNG